MSLVYYGIKKPTRVRSETPLIKDPDIYYDIYKAPDPIVFNIPFTIENNTDKDLYYKFRGETVPSGWTVEGAIWGLVPAGQKKTFTATISRVRPSSIPFPELIEDLTVVIEAYEDQDYTKLYGTVNIQLTAHGIDSQDPNWEVIDDVNFDDGDMHGWEFYDEHVSGYQYSLGHEITDQTYVTPPYSFRIWLDGYYACVRRGHLKKQFDLSTYEKVYLTFHTKISGAGSVYDITVKAGGSEYQFNLPSKDRWYKVVVPLPCDIVEVDISAYVKNAGYNNVINWYIDDIKIIGHK